MKRKRFQLGTGLSIMAIGLVFGAVGTNLPVGFVHNFADLFGGGCLLIGLVVTSFSSLRAFLIVLSLLSVIVAVPLLYWWLVQPKNSRPTAPYTARHSTEDMELIKQADDLSKGLRSQRIPVADDHRTPGKALNDLLHSHTSDGNPPSGVPHRPPTTGSGAAKLTEDRKTLEAERQRLTNPERKFDRLASDKGFQDMLSLYNAMPGRQVKGVFMTMDETSAARYLDAMEPRTVAKILKEFKSPEEADRIKHILEKMRCAPGSAAAATQAAEEHP